MQKVAVIGTTSWGITLGLLLCGKGAEVRLWTRTEGEATRIRKTGLDTARFHDVVLPERMKVTSLMDEATDDANAVILAVPSATMRQNISHVAPHLGRSTLVISASKGLEIGSNKRMSQVIAEEIHPRSHENICVISGPNLAREIMLGLPAAAVAAAEKSGTAKKAQRLLTAPNFCVFTNSDVLGVELGGALKNIIALGAGIADGLEYGDNAKAAFVTRGLTEITALGMALGANPLTFSGLAGLGDLMATCASPLSRNRFVGQELAKGRPLEEITASMTGIAEGVTTTVAALKLAGELGVEMPIAQQVYRVLYKGLDVRQGIAELMGRELKHEFADIPTGAIERT
jgi:glycerol-3-phosphate dehydrogenase (NAD(P)+)